MKIYIGADHAGFEFKSIIKEHLTRAGFEVQDFGTNYFDPEDDYPDFIKLVAEAISKKWENNSSPDCLGIILGGSGQGEAMVANRYKNVRATVYYGGSLDIIKLSKEHNNANILSVGARFLSEKEMLGAIDLWLNTKFSEEDRHVRRIAKF